MSSEHASMPSSDDVASPEPMLPVLIVDDDLVILDMLQDVLEEEGFTVVTANNGAAALYFLQQTLVALVVTDFMMPGLSGLELAERLHYDPRTATISMILMSAFPPADVGTHVVAVIGKPFALDDLLRLVHQFWPR